MLTICSSPLTTATLPLVSTKTVIGYPKRTTRRADQSSCMMLVRQLRNHQLKPIWAIRPRSFTSWSRISVELVSFGSTGLFPFPSERLASINAY